MQRRSAAIHQNRPLSRKCFSLSASKHPREDLTGGAHEDRGARLAVRVRRLRHASNGAALPVSLSSLTPRGCLTAKNEDTEKNRAIIRGVRPDRSKEFEEFDLTSNEDAMADKTWFLKRCDLFTSLTEHDLIELEACSRVQKYSRGTPVYLPADASHAMMLLISGRVKICSVSPDGKQGILTLIDPGQAFGELALLDSSSRGEYAEATEESVIAVIPAVEMRRLLARYPHLAVGMTKLMGVRRRRTERRLKYLLFHSNRQRLVNLLIELAEDYGKETEEGIELAVKLSHQDLASMIGSTRETVTVTLGELQREGVLIIRRRKIVLTGLSHLQASIENASPQQSLSTPQPHHTRIAVSSSV